MELTINKSFPPVIAHPKYVLRARPPVFFSSWTHWSKAVESYSPRGNGQRSFIASLGDGIW